MLLLRLPGREISAAKFLAGGLASGENRPSTSRSPLKLNTLSASILRPACDSRNRPSPAGHSTEIAGCREAR